MRILTALSVLQIAAIAFLLVKVVAVEREIISFAFGKENAATGDVAPESRIRIQTGSNRAPRYPDEIQLREIIREELAVGLASISGSRDAQESELVSDSSAENGHDEVVYDYQRELVRTELDYFISVGAISESEMAGLQMKIARLDEAGRKQMLRELVKALNSGDLDGRL